MRELKFLAIVILVCCLEGCSRIRVDLHTETDKSLTPIPSQFDAIAIDTPEDASIQERNLVGCVKEEMLANKINYQEKQPKYRMRLSVERKKIEAGSKASFWIPGKRSNFFQNESWLGLFLYKAEDPKKQAIWFGEIGTTSKIFTLLRHSIIKTLLSYIGKDFDKPVKIDKSYKKNKASCDS